MLGNIIAAFIIVAVSMNASYTNVSETTVTEVVELVETTEAVENVETVNNGLQFLDVDGNVLMNGSAEYIESARATFGQGSKYGNTQYYVTIYFTPEGTEKFKSVTETVLEKRANDGNYIAIAVDGVVCATPMVNEVIYSDTCIITDSSFTKETVEELATAINDGIE